MKQLSLDFSVPHIEQRFKFKRLTADDVYHLHINRGRFLSEQSRLETEITNREFERRTRHLESSMNPDDLEAENAFDRANFILEKRNLGQALSNDEIHFLLERCWLPPAIISKLIPEDRWKHFI
jgi:hypothetical protein